MSKGWKHLLLGLGFLGVALAQAEAPSPRAFFQSLLEEAGLRFEMPAGFREVPVAANPVLTYHYAVQSEDGQLEIRYVIFPLSRVRIDYNDPHSSAPEPDHLFTLLFPSVVNELSGYGPSQTREYPEEEAHRLFRADWAAAAVFDVRPEFGGGYTEALVIAIHKNGWADAYAIFLTRDLRAVVDLIQHNQAALAFDPRITGEAP